MHGNLIVREFLIHLTLKRWMGAKTIERTMTTEQQLSKAFDVASGFDVNAPHSEQDWMTLDWAMTIPGVAEEFPELLEALKEHFSITLSYNDLGNFVCSAIHAALRSVRKASINELDEFTNYYGEFIPEQVLTPIEDCVETLIQDYLDALKSFLEEED